MITDLSPKDTTVVVGDLVRVEGFLPFLEVVAVEGNFLQVKFNKLQQRVALRTVVKVRKEIR